MATHWNGKDHHQIFHFILLLLHCVCWTCNEPTLFRCNITGCYCDRCCFCVKFSQRMKQLVVYLFCTSIHKQCSFRHHQDHHWCHYFLSSWSSRMHIMCVLCVFVVRCSVFVVVDFFFCIIFGFVSMIFQVLRSHSRKQVACYNHVPWRR